MPGLLTCIIICRWNNLRSALKGPLPAIRPCFQEKCGYGCGLIYEFLD